LRVEDYDSFFGNVVGGSCFEDVGEKVWLGEDEFHMGDFGRVCEFVLGVCLVVVLVGSMLEGYSEQRLTGLVPA